MIKVSMRKLGTRLLAIGIGADWLASQPTLLLMASNCLHIVATAIINNSSLNPYRGISVQVQTKIVVAPGVRSARSRLTR